MYATRSRKVKTDLRDTRTLAEACKLGAYRPAHQRERGLLLAKAPSRAGEPRDISQRALEFRRCKPLLHASRRLPLETPPRRIVAGHLSTEARSCWSNGVP